MAIAQVAADWLTGLKEEYAKCDDLPLFSKQRIDCHLGPCPMWEDTPPLTHAVRVKRELENNLVGQERAIEIITSAFRTRSFDRPLTMHFVGVRTHLLILSFLLPAHFPQQSHNYKITCTQVTNFTFSLVSFDKLFICLCFIHNELYTKL